MIDQHFLPSSYQVHLVAVVAAAAYNAVLAAKHCHRMVVRLEDSFVGIDIQHVDSHCLTWAFVVVHNLEDNHDYLMGEVLVAEEAVDELDLGGLDVLVPGYTEGSTLSHIHTAKLHRQYHLLPFPHKLRYHSR